MQYFGFKSLYEWLVIFLSIEIFFSWIICARCLYFRLFSLCIWLKCVTVIALILVVKSDLMGIKKKYKIVLSQALYLYEIIFRRIKVNLLFTIQFYVWSTFLIRKQTNFNTFKVFYVLFSRFLNNKFYQFFIIIYKD